jgi:hypothetical protein
VGESTPERPNRPASGRVPLAPVHTARGAHSAQARPGGADQGGATLTGIQKRHGFRDGEPLGRDALPPRAPLPSHGVRLGGLRRRDAGGERPLSRGHACCLLPPCGVCGAHSTGWGAPARGARHHPCRRLRAPGRAPPTRCKRAAPLQGWAAGASSTCHADLLASGARGVHGLAHSAEAPPETRPHTRVVVVCVEYVSRTLAASWQLCRKCNRAPLRGPGLGMDDLSIGLSYPCL